MSVTIPAAPAAGADARQDAALAVLRAAARAGELVHIEHIPGKPGTTARWPDSVRSDVAAALAARGVRQPWTHQAEAAALAGSARNVIIATRAASGKSAGYLAAALSAAGNGGTVLYIAPTKALAADQAQAVRALGLPWVRAACYDGDSTAADRAWAQAHANYLLTNPDMLHAVMLPGHVRWRGFFQRLRVVIIDECHAYRGVFGSHVAQVLRRLRRVAAHYAPRDGTGPGPVFVLASATIADPRGCARLLTGLDAEAVTADGSPRAPLTFALWEPPLRYTRPDVRIRRPATSEAADLLAGLAGAGVPALAFIRSRRGAETVALTARQLLAAGKADLAAAEAGGDGGAAIAAYRSGYLADDRRDLEARLRDGLITGMAATTALELGINIPALDAVLITGWPGTWASLWQQAGRAGRAGRTATAVFIARDDPLDSFLVHHPAALLHHPLEPTVLDPANPCVLTPHLGAAAAELPLTEPDLALFSAGAPEAATATTGASAAVTTGASAAVTAAVVSLTSAGELRQRQSGWYWARRGHPARRISLRGGGARPIRIVEESTGRLVGTTDEASAHRSAHGGAVYLHQGETYLVSRLDLADRVALVECEDPGYTTSARDITDIEVVNASRKVSWCEAHVAFGEVRVTRQVVSYTIVPKPDAVRSDNTFRHQAEFRARGLSDTESIRGFRSEIPLSLPPRELITKAVWWTMPNDLLLRRGIADIPGAAHAAEHAAIGMLPLFATCDRWDVGGVSTERHAATGQLTVFVYDGYEGGAGFAERGFLTAADWLRATAGAIEACPCEAGCPSCVQSPKCGNGNSPLSKPGAVALLGELLRQSSG